VCCAATAPRRTLSASFTLIILFHGRRVEGRVSKIFGRYAVHAISDGAIDTTIRFCRDLDTKSFIRGLWRRHSAHHRRSWPASYQIFHCRAPPPAVAVDAHREGDGLGDDAASLAHLSATRSLWTTISSDATGYNCVDDQVTANRKIWDRRVQIAVGLRRTVLAACRQKPPNPGWPIQRVRHGQASLTRY
jgi:hypothetical protein